MTSLLIQIKRWLMQPHVWRFVGFASTLVGLSCYALSFSFNLLFGHWNFLKLLLYCVSSVIISLAVLFAKVWQYSSNRRCKAHGAFLILTITSVYSFVYDKAVNKKPDAYGLISCAAFAVMSLSLSRQTHWGYEVDLLYFFLGALITQLMKVQLWLVILGLLFSYSIVILRSSLDSPSAGVELQDQHHLAIQVDPQQSNTVSTPQQEAPRPNNPVLLVEALEMLREADSNHLYRLPHQLRDYLADKVDHFPSELVNDPNFLVDLLFYKKDIQENVKLIMKDSGLLNEFQEKYVSLRRESLEMFMSQLNFKEIITNGIVDERNIETWKKASNVILKILFPNERRLCHQIFLGYPSIADDTFTQICSQVVDTLLSSTMDFTYQMPNLDNFPRSLQVFKKLRDIIPWFVSLFSNHYSASLRTKATTAMKRFGEGIRDYYYEELVYLISHDTKQESVPGGIYPITVDVMNRLDGIFKARETFELIFQDYPVVAVGEGVIHWLSRHMARIIELLERHLEAKSENYPNQALRYVFLMNNGRYIERKAQETQLSVVLGDDWIQRQAAKIRKNLELYHRSSWDEILGFLKLYNNEEVNVTAESMKEKLALFNTQIREIWKVQSEWFVNDDELSVEIRKPLENILLPAYGIFIGRFRDVLRNDANEYIRYSMSDIQSLLSDLFSRKDE